MILAAASQARGTQEWFRADHAGVRALGGAPSTNYSTA